MLWFLWVKNYLIFSHGLKTMMWIPHFLIYIVVPLKNYILWFLFVENNIVDPKFPGLYFGSHKKYIRLPMVVPVHIWKNIQIEQSSQFANKHVSQVAS